MFLNDLKYVSDVLMAVREDVSLPLRKSFDKLKIMTNDKPRNKETLQLNGRC